MIDPNRVLPIHLASLQLRFDEWSDVLFEHLLVEVVGVRPEVEDARYQPALLRVAYLFPLRLSPFGHYGRFDSIKDLQVMMPNDAEKPQEFGLQLQRPILDHPLKLASILAISLRDLVEVDHVDLAGFFDDVSDSLQSEQCLVWFSSGESGQEELDEFSEVGEVDEVIFAVEELARRKCKGDELAFEVSMHEAYHCSLLLLRQIREGCYHDTQQLAPYFALYYLQSAADLKPGQQILAFDYFGHLLTESGEAVPELHDVVRMLVHCLVGPFLLQ